MGTSELVARDGGGMPELSRALVLAGLRSWEEWQGEALVCPTTVGEVESQQVGALSSELPSVLPDPVRPSL